MCHRMRPGLAAALLNSAALMLAVCCAAPAAAEDFYAGKQITFIVGAGVGGGYDLQARVTARHLGKHIPGKPSIIVQNMPARIAAANHMFSTAPKDGTTIALIQRGMLLAKLIYPSGTRFEIEKFNWLGSLNSETAVTLAWHTAAHKTAKDLFEQELIVGGITGVDPETTPKLYNSLLGTKFKVVTGYNSTAQIALAIERGEVHGHRRLVVVERQGGAAGLAARQEGRAAHAGRAAQGARARKPAVGARLHQERRRPQGPGAALHAEDRGPAGHCAARRVRPTRSPSCARRLPRSRTTRSSWPKPRRARSSSASFPARRSTRSSRSSSQRPPTSPTAMQRRLDRRNRARPPVPLKRERA